MKWGQIVEEHGGPDTWRPDISIERNWSAGDHEFNWSALGEKGPAHSLKGAQEAVDRVVERHYATAAARSEAEVTEVKRKRLVEAGSAYDAATRAAEAARDAEIEAHSALTGAKVALAAATKEKARRLQRWEEEKAAR